MSESESESFLMLTTLLSLSEKNTNPSPSPDTRHTNGTLLLIENLPLNVPLCHCTSPSTSLTRMSMMRRVSSRQRLVSWDAFDATVNAESDEEQDFVTCYEASLSRQSSFTLEESLLDVSHRGMTVSMSISPVNRKRERGCSEPDMKKSVSFSNLPVVISALKCELEDPRLDSLIEKTFLEFDLLMEDVKLHIFSFLSVPEARTMASVSKHYRLLLSSPEAVSLWTEWIRRRWSTFSLIDGRNVVDLLQMPIAACSSQELNFGVLLGHAARHQPTGVDKSLLVTPPPSTRRLRSFRQDTTPRRTMFRIMESSVQYTGPVGSGDRCIRGDQPLARPGQKRLLPSFYNQASLLEIFCRKAAAAVASGPLWRPFVAPYVSENGEIHMTPRLVSYYEVSIKSCPDDFHFGQHGVERNPRGSDCVAVGVATNAFHLHSRMPGWDMVSYGYHGDDGGIFHDSGNMTRHFGPSFGEGDTVGCGIDYIERGIFFTLNGKFLGFGWTNVDLEFLQQELYPTVGVDTNFPVEFNFGERPFSFDLTTMVERQKPVVRAWLNRN